MSWRNSARQRHPSPEKDGKGESMVEVCKSPAGCILCCSSPRLRALEPALLVGVLLPGSEFKQGRNLLLHGRSPSAADVALEAARGSPHRLVPLLAMLGTDPGQEISTEGSLCHPRSL